MSTNSSQSSLFVLSPDKCNKSVKCVLSLVLNTLAALIIVFLTALALIPHLKALVGSIHVDEQPFTLGINGAVNRLIGNLAGSIIVGQALDVTCKIWQTNCYDQRSCKLYNNFRMSLVFTVIGFTCRFLTAIFTFIACCGFYWEMRRDKKIISSGNTISGGGGGANSQQNQLTAPMASSSNLTAVNPDLDKEIDDFFVIASF